MIVIHAGDTLAAYAERYAEVATRRIPSAKMSPGGYSSLKRSCHPGIMATDGQMTINGRRKYLRIVRISYQRAERVEQGRMLHAMATATGLARKTPLRLLGSNLQRVACQRQRSRTYAPWHSARFACWHLAQRPPTAFEFARELTGHVALAGWRRYWPTTYRTERGAFRVPADFPAPIAV